MGIFLLIHESHIAEHGEIRNTSLSHLVDLLVLLKNSSVSVQLDNQPNFSSI